VQLKGRGIVYQWLSNGGGASSVGLLGHGVTLELLMDIRY